MPPSAVSDEDLATCVRVLKALAPSEGGISDEFSQPRLKPLRVVLQCFLDDLRGKLFYGGDPDKYARRKDNKRRQAARAQQERAKDIQAVDKTFMRAERIRMLEELQTAEPRLIDAPLIPDGAVGESASRPDLLAPARWSPADDANEVAPGSSAGDAAEQLDDTSDGLTTASVSLRATSPESAELQRLRACYTCKQRYRQLHAFYAQLCPNCAELNYAKRTQACRPCGHTLPTTLARCILYVSCLGVAIGFSLLFGALPHDGTCVWLLHH